MPEIDFGDFPTRYGAVSRPFEQGFQPVAGLIEVVLDVQIVAALDGVL